MARTATTGRTINRSGQTQRSRAQISGTWPISSPTGGLNAIDSVAAMPDTDALVLDNWFPQPTYVQLRNGYDSWATGLPTWVETVMPYSSAAGEFLYGISGTSVYDVSNAGAVGAAVVTGLTNARWEYTNVATAGGQFLYAANATDKPLLYNGTTWTKVDGASTPAITGVTTTLLRNPIVWKNRVWFVEDRSMRAWYLPTASVGGAAASFDLGPLMRLGGKLQAILTATVSNGSTFDDYIGFLSSEGELALYQGTDPASDFAIVGIYPFGKPIGRRCYFRYGNDTIIICSDGLVSLQKAISVKFKGADQAISYKIQQLVNADIQAYGTHFGWEGVIHPLGNKIIVNVPIAENFTQSQYVQNTLNNSWCTYGRFNSPWNAATFASQGDNLYFGGDGYVALADQGQSDDGATITGTLKTAFSYLGTDQQKFITGIRPLIQTTGTLAPILGLNLDFQDVRPTAIPQFGPVSGSTWNIAPWNTSSWTTGYSLQKTWLTATGIGFSVATYFIVSANEAQVNFMALDYIYQRGGVY